MATLEDEGLTIDVLDHQGIVLLALHGELTGMEAPELQAVVGEVLEKMPRNLQLGLDGVRFIDSGGMRALVSVHLRANTANVPMQLLGPPPQVRRVLEIAGLLGVFEVVD